MVVVDHAVGGLTSDQSASVGRRLSARNNRPIPDVVEGHPR
jgi:hypothetical protein